MIKIGAVVVAGLFLTACAGSQEFTGQRTVKFDYSENGQPKLIEYLDAKDDENVNISYSVDRPDGTKVRINYSANLSVNSTGATVRADAEKAKAETASEVITETIPSVVDTVVNPF